MNVWLKHCGQILQFSEKLNHYVIWLFFELLFAIWVDISPLYAKLRAISGFQADLGCRRSIWSTLSRFARVDNIANRLSFFSSSLQRALIKQNWHLTMRNGCLIFARMLAFKYSMSMAVLFFWGCFSVPGLYMVVWQSAIPNPYIAALPAFLVSGIARDEFLVAVQQVFQLNQVTFILFSLAMFWYL